MGSGAGAGRGRRTAVVATLVLALLAVGAGAGWAYVRSQYYVGVDGEQVAIFRGVSGSVGPLRLSSVEMRTELETDRLDRIAANRVEQGIVVEDRDAAEQVVERLRERFPACDDTTTTPPVPSPPALPTAVAVPTAAAALPTAVPTVAVTPPPALDGACPAGTS